MLTTTGKKKGEYTKYIIFIYLVYKDEDEKSNCSCYPNEMQ